MESAMRECLSQGAWCDVRLACGGREFRAHRVVLSSVSPFLRVLLQSRPEEDVPTTIVMPEVDVDAMSAVLHYIYNGEVSVPTQHLDAFFNIVKTLQICVDKKALISFREKIEDFDTKILDTEVIKNIVTAKIIPGLKNLNEMDAATMKKFSGIVENTPLDLEHVIKGDRICKSISPCSTDVGLRLRSDLGPISRMEGQRRQPLRLNKQDPHSDNRRGSPGRDSPQRALPTSSCNGPATCVHAIASDDNLEPKSAVTNEADGWRIASSLDASEIPSLVNRRMRHRESDTAPDSRKRTDCTKNSLPNSTYRKDRRQPTGNTFDYNSTVRLRDLRSDIRLTDSRMGQCTVNDPVRKPAVLRPVPTLLPIAPMYNITPPPRPVVEHNSYFRPPPDLLDLSSAHLASLNLLRTTTSADDPRIALINGYAGTRSHQNNLFAPTYSSVTYQSDRPSRLLDGFGSGKRTIEEMEYDRSRMRRTAYNKVLASPWCPRLPPTYRPPHPLPAPPDYAHTSVPHSSQLPPVSTTDELMTEQLSPGSSVIVDDIDDKCSNDDNNNIKHVAAPDPDSPISIKNENTSRTPAVTPHSIDAIIGKDPSAGPAMRCATCDKVFTSRTTLATHVRAHAAAASARHTCPDCGKSFSQLRNFKYHVSVHRGTREFAATCNVCGKYFNDRGYLSSHMKIHRNRKEYECPHCPKSFNQRVAYNMHVRIHTGVKPHVCSECGKAFSRKMLLKQHQRTHSGERPYACSVCDKRFADRSNMTLHMRLHSGVKPFSCNLCPKSFTKKHHLKTHLNYHTGDKPYACPRCQLAFSQSSNMRTHLKKCGGQMTPTMASSILAPA